jgi:hypothetical protein
LTVRLRWNQAGLDHGGAFVLHDAPLFLLVSASGELDRLHQDPDGRVGLVVEIAADGNKLHFQGRGGMGFLVNGKIRDEAELAFGSNLLCACEDQQWRLCAEGEPVLADPLVGTELGGYKVLERLGNGSVGVVYRAVQLKLDREVALKVLAPSAAKKSPLAVASFKREAVAAGRLSHPNLVQVYDVGLERGLHFFSMELVPGGDLEDLLDERGPLPWREALGHVLDCVAALSFAREHKLVHRDVKPENLMLTIDGRTKLADLGMAATRGMLESTAAGGTPHFMAPEVVTGEAVDYRSDFYSLGCTLFRLLTAATPFDGEDVREILLGHRDLPVPSLKDHGVEAPPGVQELVAWLMAKDPTERPQSCAEIRTEIEELLAARKSNGLLFGVLAVAVVAVGISLYSVLNPGSDEPQDPLIVEVEHPDAQAQRERTARLEEELAFTQAMAVAEGPQREAALHDFLGRFRDSEFRFQALDEMERLAGLPAAGLSAAETAAEAEAAAASAARRQLVALENDLQQLLGQQAFGKAQVLLAASSLPADQLVPLWSRVADTSAKVFRDWQARHAELLAAEDWPAATALRARYAAGIEEAVRNQASWREPLLVLERDAADAHQAALQQQFDSTRIAVVARLRVEVLPRVEAMDFVAAEAALLEVIASCDHPQLAAALQQRLVLFQQAQAVMDALRARLDGSREIDITEPLDGKRAFTRKADSEGVHLQVQVRGERVARVDPWTSFFAPDILPLFLDQVLGSAVEDRDERLALQLLVASASAARDLQEWSVQVPERAAAADEALRLAGWLAVLDARHLPDEHVVFPELRALLEMLDLSEALADADSYAAMLHARGLGHDFSLLAAWSSSGETSWEFTP